MTIEQLSVEHPYYCNESSYYGNQATSEFDIWEEFMNEWGNADKDRNLVFRFDIYKSDECDDYYMYVFFIIQRKGYFFPVRINHISDKDADSISEYLSQAYNKLTSIWHPFNS